jgi:hypothetical protein
LRPKHELCSLSNSRLAISISCFQLTKAFLRNRVWFTSRKSHNFKAKQYYQFYLMSSSSDWVLRLRHISSNILDRRRQSLYVVSITANPNSDSRGVLQPNYFINSRFNWRKSIKIAIKVFILINWRQKQDKKLKRILLSVDYLRSLRKVKAEVDLKTCN